MKETSFPIKKVVQFPPKKAIIRLTKEDEVSKMEETYQITLPQNQENIPLQELLEIKWQVPRKVRHLLRMRKNVSVNGETALFQQVVQGGDLISITIEESDYSYQPVLLGEAAKVSVLYEDPHLIIVNKPAGIKTHPNQPEENGTMQNHLAAYLAKSGSRPYVVHRLDQETSGALMFAKNPLVLPILSRLLEEKQIYRRYQAVVSGKLKGDRTIDQKIGRDRHDRRKRRIDPRGGQTAITHVSVAGGDNKHTEVYCLLDTGRTHQIRVHLTSIGHPIVGDPLYGKETASRLMLHAYEMHFRHPFQQTETTVQALPGLW